MSNEEKVRILLELYKIECADNGELYRRASLVLTASVIVGTLSVSLLRSSELLTLWPAPSTVLLLVFAALGMLCLAGSVIALASALLPQDWEYPEVESLFAEEPTECNEHLVEVVHGARETNKTRFVRLQRSLQLLLLAVLLLGLQAAMVGIMALTASAATPPS